MKAVISYVVAGEPEKHHKPFQWKVEIASEGDAPEAILAE
jgi:hypothetical protein